MQVEVRPEAPAEEISVATAIRQDTTLQLAISCMDILTSGSRSMEKEKEGKLLNKETKGKELLSMRRLTS